MAGDYRLHGPTTDATTALLRRRLFVSRKRRRKLLSTTGHYYSWTDSKGSVRITDCNTISHRNIIHIWMNMWRDPLTLLKDSIENKGGGTLSSEIFALLRVAQTWVRQSTERDLRDSPFEMIDLSRQQTPSFHRLAYHQNQHSALVRRHDCVITWLLVLKGTCSLFTEYWSWDHRLITIWLSRPNYLIWTQWIIIQQLLLLSFVYIGFD